MFKRLLKRHLAHRQLIELYRQAEEGSLAPEPDAILGEVFEADRTIVAHLRQVASDPGPTSPAALRALLLTRLAEQRRSRQSQERAPLIRQVFHRRTAALAAAAALVVGGAVTANAAGGGVSGVAGNVQDVLAALHITDRTPDQADGHIDNIQQPAGTNNTDQPANATGATGLDSANQHANDNAQHGLDTAAEGSGNAGEGIQNASGEGLDHANGNALDGPGASPTSTPAAQVPGQADGNASEGADNAADQGRNGDVPLPTQASDHAGEGGGNAHPPEVLPNGTPLSRP